jgi:hypothetical protein
LNKGQQGINPRPSNLGNQQKTIKKSTISGRQSAAGNQSKTICNQQDHQRHFYKAISRGSQQFDSPPHSPIMVLIIPP